MSLILPDHLRNSDSDPQGGIAMGTYYRYSDLTDRSVSVSDLVQNLAQFKRSVLIKYLVLILTTVSSDDGMKPGTQVQLARELLEPDLLDRYLKHLRKPGVLPGCVFWARQIHFLSQLAVLSSNENVADRGEDELRQAVGRCCLMASDLLHEIEPKDAPAQGTEQFNVWFASTVIPILERRVGFEVLARARNFWFQIPKLPELESKLAQINASSFAAAFHERHGVHLREYYLILVSFCMHFLTHAKSAAVLVDQSTYLLPTFSSEDASRVMRTISQPPDRLALSLLGTARQNWSFDHTMLRRYPLLEIFPGRHACLDQSILMRSLTDKIYFLLQEAYDENQFNQMFGLIFEEYVFSHLRSAVGASSGMERAFFPNPRFQGREEEAGDVILMKDGLAIVMECKARLLTTLEKYGGQRTITMRGVDHILAKSDARSKKGVAQLASTLPRLLNGETFTSGPGGPVTLHQCHTIIPVIVTFEESIGFEAVRQIAELKFSKLLAQSKTAPLRVGSLLILTIRDIELLEALAGSHSPIDLIRDYAAYVPTDPKHKAGSFGSFVSDRRLTYDSNIRLSLTDRNQRLAMDEAVAELEPRMPPG